MGPPKGCKGGGGGKLGPPSAGPWLEPWPAPYSPDWYGPYGYPPMKGKGGPPPWGPDPYAAPPSAGLPALSDRAWAAPPPMSEKDELIHGVKGIQRSNPEGKNMWERYVTALRTGNNDPIKHSAESLRNFIESFERGEDVETRAKKVARTMKVLRLRGVPFQSKISDVVEFLHKYNVEDSDVALGYGADGRRTGEAFVAFKSNQQAESALESMQRQEIEGRYIELFRSSQEDMEQATAHGGSKGTKGGGEKEDLVARVKWVQRSDEAGKENWYTYCDISRTGNRDPSKHSAESMRIFLEAHERGEGPEKAAERAEKSCRVLRLRGVPFQSTIQEVVGFLSEFGVNESTAALGYGIDGRRTGEAFATFKTPELAAKVLSQKQKQEIGGRYIELFRSSEEEMREASDLGSLATMSTSLANDKDSLVARVKGIQKTGTDGREKWEAYCDRLRTGNRDPSRHSIESIRNFLEAYERGEEPQAIQGLEETGDGRVLRLRGIPFQADIADIARFLSDYGLDRTHITMGFAPDGKKSGQAFAVFHTAEDAEKALEERQRHEIHNRYIELFRSNYQERDESIANSKLLTMPAAPGCFGKGWGKDDPWGAGKGCGWGPPALAWGPPDGLAEGPPMTEKERLITRIKALQKGSSEGKENWEAFCDALQNGTRDPLRHNVTSLTVFLEAWERGEAPEAAAARCGGDGRVLRLRGVPFQSDLMDVVNFLSSFSVDKSMVTMGREKGGKATGEAFVILPSKDLAERALEEKQNKEIKGRYIELFRSTYEDVENACPVGPAGKWTEKDELAARVKGIQRNDENGKELWYKFCDDLRSGNRDPTRHNADSLAAFLEAYDKGETVDISKVGDGRVLRLRGVPFQCTVKDVVDFLSGYGIDDIQVAIGRAKGGKVTGDAHVVFPNREVAERALEERQKKEIAGRYIEVFRSNYDEWEQAAAGGLETESLAAVPASPSAANSVPLGGAFQGDPWGDPWGKGGYWGGKGDPWAGKGDPWAGKGDPWAGKGDPWAGKGDPWAGKGDPWAGKGDPWAGKGDPWGWGSKGDPWGKGDYWYGKGDPWGKGPPPGWGDGGYGAWGPPSASKGSWSSPYDAKGGKGWETEGKGKGWDAWADGKGGWDPYGWDGGKGKGWEPDVKGGKGWEPEAKGGKGWEPDAKGGKGGKVWESQANGIIAWETDAKGGKGWESDAKGGKGWEPDAKGGKGGKGWESNAKGGKGWESDAKGGKGWESDAKGGKGWESDAKGGKGWEPDAKGGKGWGPDAKGGKGWEPDAKGGKGWDSGKGWQEDPGAWGAGAPKGGGGKLGPSSAGDAAKGKGKGWDDGKGDYGPSWADGKGSKGGPYGGGGKGKW